MDQMASTTRADVAWAEDVASQETEIAPTQARSLSEAIFAPVNRAYKLGGLGLSFLSLGAFMMVSVALVVDEPTLLSGVVAVSGFVLVMATCALFYVKDIRPMFRLQRNIQENKELIDAVQKTAIEMTEMASDLQALLFKHADRIASIIQMLRPKIHAIPMLGPSLANHPLLTSAEDLSATIVHATKRAKSVIADVEAALVNSDPSSLKIYLGELHELRDRIEQLLAGKLESNGELNQSDLVAVG
jgi:hypothetical protein